MSAGGGVERPLAAGELTGVTRCHELDQRATILLRNRVQCGGYPTQLLLGLEQQQIGLSQGDDIGAQIGHSRFSHPGKLIAQLATHRFDHSRRIDTGGSLFERFNLGTQFGNLAAQGRDLAAVVVGRGRRTAGRQLILVDMPTQSLRTRPRPPLNLAGFNRVLQGAAVDVQTPRSIL